MVLGVFSILFNNLSLEEVLKKCVNLGISHIEIGCGGYSKSNHMDVDRVICDQQYLCDFKALLDKYEITISALGAQGNPVHPNKNKATAYHIDYEKALIAAKRLNVDTVLLLSGCPGGSPADVTPNWITCPWPEDYSEAYDYQWNEVLIPYWQKAIKLAEEHGVERLAIEPHPGFCVYNPQTLLRLRNETGNRIGVNFDPSHLFWQGIDPLAAIDALSDCIYHVHAKDSYINEQIVQKDGVLDPKPYQKFNSRSWNFRTVGYGHSSKVWKDIISRLAMAGYEGVISIEHEDALMSNEEGLGKAAALLRDIIINEQTGPKWWELRPEG